MPPTKGNSVIPVFSDPNFREQLVELYKMYYTLFFEKFQIYETYFELPYIKLLRR